MAKPAFAVGFGTTGDEATRHPQRRDYARRPPWLQPLHLSSIVTAPYGRPIGVRSRIIPLRWRGEKFVTCQFATAVLLVSVCAACSSGAAAPEPQQLALWSGIAPEFTNDLIQRFNRTLPET